MNDEEFTWHGWGILDLKGDKSASLSIGYLPRRKSPALYMNVGNDLKVLAYFRDEQSARQGLALFDRIVEVTPFMSQRSDRTEAL